MQGFDYDQARRALNVPENYAVLAMVAIGKRAPKESLPPRLLNREFPNSRRSLDEIVLEGRF